MAPTTHAWPGIIPNADVDVDSPLTQDLFFDLRDSVSNVREALADPASYTADLKDHEHDGVGSKMISAGNLVGEQEPRAEMFGVMAYQQDTSAPSREKGVDLMLNLPEWGFMMEPERATDWIVSTPNMGSGNSRVLSTQVIAGAGVYFDNWRFLGPTVSDQPYRTTNEIAVLLMLASQAGICQVGSYAGTGVGGLQVAHGIGSTPDAILIMRNTGNGHRLIGWTSGHAAGNSQRHNGNIIATGITAVDATNFTLGADASVNAAAVSYQFVALKGGKFGGEEFGLLTWTGNGGGNRNIDGLGFDPDVVIALEVDTGQDWRARCRWAGQDSDCRNIETAGSDANGILQMREDGIRVGSSLNTNLEEYEALCFKGVMRWA